MIVKSLPIRVLALSGVALTLVLPLAGCETKEKPPVIDTTSPIKDPSTPATNIITPEPKTAK